MEAFKELERYIAHLSEGLGHADRHAGLKGYCTGLMLPLGRKSVEPMAAGIDPLHVSARYKALPHFVVKSEWPDAAVLERVRDWVAPSLGLEDGCYWIIDDTGFPKKGRHSVGVARQYCGQWGKPDNCQVAVSLSLASAQGSVPVAYQLYLPQDWADDPARRRGSRGSCICDQAGHCLGADAPGHQPGRASGRGAGRCRLWRGDRLSGRHHGP